MKKRFQNRLLKSLNVICVCLLLAAGCYKYSSAYVSVSDNPTGREQPINCVHTEENKIALTFEAMWGNEDVQEILEVLRKHSVHATFFLTGDWVEKYPADVKAIYKEGHDIGNHSESHRNMTQLSEKEKTQELVSVHEKVKALTGMDMHFFRPPYGAYDDAVIINARENGYDTVNWNVDSEDWKEYGENEMIKAVLYHPELKNGSIILLHCGAKYTADALEELVVGLQAKGYELISLSELVKNVL